MTSSRSSILKVLVELAQRSGHPFDRNQCYAVFDTEASGAPRTIVAAYTNDQIWLNGEEILGPGDFGNDVAFIDRPVTLGAGNELTVGFAGVPGSKMLVILKSENWDAP